MANLSVFTIYLKKYEMAQKNPACNLSLPVAL